MLRASCYYDRWEHAERLSRSLLERTDALLRRGTVAFGEVFTSSVCAQTRGCECEDLRDAGSRAAIQTHLQPSG